MRARGGTPRSALAAVRANDSGPAAITLGYGVGYATGQSICGRPLVAIFCLRLRSRRQNLSSSLFQDNRFRQREHTRTGLLKRHSQGAAFAMCWHGPSRQSFGLQSCLFTLIRPTLLLRVRERVRKGGHDVPEDDVRRRFSRTFRNFWHVYRQIADYWHLIYNAGGSSREIAFGDGQTTILDELRFRRFLELAGAASDDSTND
jgi:hypothetical protein